MRPFETSPNLDDLLLDIATVIELSDNDRSVAASRYVKLKEHLERPSSALRPYLVKDDSRIYAQGSMAIGATVLSGTEDDRFDVDAIVEICVPPSWSPSDVLDKLEESLQGFPDVRKILRCTRCIQLQFAFMHMDVTVLDPTAEPRVERTGDIFHSPDDKKGEKRVPSNPYGFSRWVRENVVMQIDEHDHFAEHVRERRKSAGIDRLSRDMRAATQDELPPSVPPRLDAQQIVELKLMKRFLNLRYFNGTAKRPPSIYITKTAVDVGHENLGLSAQIERHAAYLISEMDIAIAQNHGPDERNPRYEKDLINDRWPASQADRRLLKQNMEFLINALGRAKRSSVSDIARVLSELFGEPVTKRAVSQLIGRSDEVDGKTGVLYERGTGAILTAATLTTPAIAKNTAVVRDHSFHDELVDGTKRYR